MLKILHNLSDLDFDQVINVYRESVNQDDQKHGTVEREQILLDDLSLFLSEQGTRLCVWDVAGRYVSCVRCERYRDGFLLTCLETAPEDRRKGYASSLIKALISKIENAGVFPYYVHVHNRNIASIRLHKQLCFSVIADYARLVDGTVSRSYCTMRYN